LGPGFVVGPILGVLVRIVASESCRRSVYFARTAIAVRGSPFARISTLVWPLDAAGEGLIRVAVGLEDAANLEAVSPWDWVILDSKKRTSVYFGAGGKRLTALLK
jgi:hypothetical protein